MAQAMVVGFDVEAGNRILKLLDASDLKVPIALWILSDYYDEWRLVLASPDFDQTNKLKAYEQFSKALQNRYPIMPPPLLIFPMKDPFIKDLRRMYGKKEGIEGLHLGSQVMGKTSVSDAYIYRIA
jgi:hypothetical protein